MNAIDSFILHGLSGSSILKKKDCGNYRIEIFNTFLWGVSYILTVSCTDGLKNMCCKNIISFIFIYTPSKIKKFNKI